MRPKLYTEGTVRRAVRLPPDLAARVDCYASTHNMTANAATIRLLELALSGTPETTK